MLGLTDRTARPEGTTRGSTGKAWRRGLEWRRWLVAFAWATLAASPALAAEAPQEALRAADSPIVRTVMVEPGGTLEDVLRGAGAGAVEAAEAILALSRRFDPRDLMPGQEIELRFTAEDPPRLQRVRMVRGEIRDIETVLVRGGGFVARTYGPPAGAGAGGPPLAWVRAGIVARNRELHDGQTLMDASLALGARRYEADAAIRSLAGALDLRRLQIGQTVTATFRDDGRLLGLAVNLDGDVQAAAFLSAAGHFHAQRTTGAEREKWSAPTVAAAAPREPVAQAVPAAVVPETVEVATGTLRQGDTLIEAAMRLGARGGEAFVASEALAGIHPLRRLRPGQEVTVALGRRAGDETRRLLSLSVAVDGEAEPTALLADRGGFTVLRATPGERAAALARIAPAPAAAPAPAGPAEPSVADDRERRTLIVRRGDTLMDAAISLGAGAGEAFEAAEALTDIFNPRQLRIGQVVTATFGRFEADGDRRLLVLAVAVEPVAEVAAFLSEGGAYTPRRLLKDEAERLAATAPGLAEAPEPEPPPAFDWVATIDRTIAVSPGDTLMEAVLSTGAAVADAVEAVEALTEIFNPRKLRVGTAIRATFATDGAGEWGDRLVALNVAVEVDREVAALRARNDGAFVPRVIEKPLEARPIRAGGVIDDSLYLSAERVDVPPNTLIELIRLFSWNVDFQRDIHPGDRFDVYFERLHNESGVPVKEGRILYAALTLSGTAQEIYRHETDDGIIDYYSPEGHSVRRALLRTPIDGARLSSAFGMRRHPILGYTRMHRGVDFAAPTGTPVKAAGDGVVETVGSDAGGYGNYLRIRHNGEYKTVYAHLSRFASGIQAGARVRQGQTVAFVGSTGLSTGPHLHYEVLKNGVQVNPVDADLPVGRRLSGVALAAFDRARAAVDAGRAAAPALAWAAAAE